MSASRLTAATYPSKQYSSRSGVVPTVLQLHHGATTSAPWMRDAMTSGSKQVSANYICTIDGKLWNIVDEIYRAWTSASGFWDRKSITVETTNLSANGWTISDASHEALAQLAADCSRRYGWGKLNRSGPFSTWNVIGHREINQYTGDSYATACPGSLDLDRVVRRANEILAGPTAPTPKPSQVEEVISKAEEDGMVVYLHRSDDRKEQALYEYDPLTGSKEIHEQSANDWAVRKLTRQNEKTDRIPELIGAEKSMIDNRAAARLAVVAKAVADQVKAQ